MAFENVISQSESENRNYRVHFPKTVGTSRRTISCGASSLPKKN